MRALHLRVVITTVAFGMGIDCADVRQVCHAGPPKDKECYIQETGWPGLDCGHSFALLMVIKGIRIYHTDASMQSYVHSTTCWRNSLFEGFEEYKENSNNNCLAML